MKLFPFCSDLYRAELSKSVEERLARSADRAWDRWPEARYISWGLRVAGDSHSAGTCRRTPIAAFVKDGSEGL
jgi:hypothetical protein